MDRRAKTSDGSGGASPSVMTSHRDDAAAEPVSAGDQPAETAAAKANDQDRPDGATANGVPGLPADSVGQARDSAAGASVAAAAASAPGSAAAAPAQDGSSKPADSRPATAGAGPAANGAASAARGTGRPSDATSPAAAAATSPRPAPRSRLRAPRPRPIRRRPLSPPPPSSGTQTNPLRRRPHLRPGTSFAPAWPRPRRPPRGRWRPSIPGRPASRGPRVRSRPGRPKRSARQAHLTVARIEPWSVMKFSFVVSLVAFVILFVAVSILYGTLAALGVFDSIQHTAENLTSSTDSSGVNAGNWFTASGSSATRPCSDPSTSCSSPPCPPSRR